MFAEVLVKANFGSALTYTISPKDYPRALVGSLVVVPFGQTTKFGLIIRLSKKRPPLKTKLKPVVKVLATNWITVESIALTIKISSLTHQPVSNILFKFVPSLLKKTNMDLPLPSQIRGKFDRYAIYNSLAERVKTYRNLSQRLTEVNQQVMIISPQSTHKLIKENLTDLDAVTVTNLNPTQENDVYIKWRKNYVKILIGTRKIIGWPAANLGLIVVDDVHNIAHQDEQRPYLDSSTLAWYRVKIEQTKLLIGASLPSLGLLQREQNKQIKRIKSKPRPPQIKLIKITSQLLARTTIEALNKAKTPLIIAPRTGFGGTLSCISCGWSLTCPKCDGNVNLIESKSFFNCLNCQLNQNTPSNCQSCSGHNLRSFGIGVDAIKEILQKHNINHATVGTEQALGLKHDLIVWSFADSTLLNPNLERPINFLAQIKEWAGRIPSVVQTLNLESKYWQILISEKPLYQLLAKRQQKNLPPFRQTLRIETKDLNKQASLVNKLKKEGLDITSSKIVNDRAIIELLLDSNQVSLVLAELSKVTGITIKVDSVINFASQSAKRRVNANRTYYRSLHSN
ncbi:hypothetical protein KC644_03705 [Candidatus Berkelbacteria bacterium]|nr:hypothetical protein [Candidatus Berkelbacteria bacterium]